MASIFESMNDTIVVTTQTNLTIAAHGECVDFLCKFDTPLLVHGGRRLYVSRYWTYETAVLVGKYIPDELPATVHDAFFEDSQWPPLTGKVDNRNSLVHHRRHS
jgi:hypothetical protein